MPDDFNDLLQSKFWSSISKTKVKKATVQEENKIKKLSQESVNEIFVHYNLSEDDDDHKPSSEEKWDLLDENQKQWARSKGYDFNTLFISKLKIPNFSLQQKIQFTKIRCLSAKIA